MVPTIGGVFKKVKKAAKKNSKIKTKKVAQPSKLKSLTDTKEGKKLKRKLKKQSGPKIVKIPAGPAGSIPIPVPRRGKVKKSAKNAKSIAAKKGWVTRRRNANK